MGRSILAATVFALLLTATSSYAQIRITEWEYNGSGAGDTPTGEFVELMNIGNSAIDMTGWSFDDASAVAGSFSLSAFGVVQAKEFVLITEGTPADFRTRWNLPASIKVIGGNNQNLSRNDGISIFDNSSQLVDQLVYGDQDIPGTIRTNGFSGNPMTVAAVGARNVALWKRSSVGDEYGSYASSEGNVGNPGKFALIPEPGTLVLLLFGIGGAAWRRRAR